MRAIGLTRYLPVDDPAAFEEVELPTPSATGHDLLVRVRAVSVNPVDTKVRAPKPGVEPTPRVLGWDAAGVVEAVGDQVSLFRPGDQVYYAGSIMRPGCNSEYHLVDERIVGFMPRTLSFEQAAALPLTSLTAWEALFDRLGIEPHATPLNQARTLLVIGGAGGVGSIATQIAARVAGLRVLATASRPESAAWCERMGAAATLDHHAPLRAGLDALAIDGVDYILCCNSLERYFDAMVELIRPQGKICTIVGTKDNQPVHINQWMGKSISFSFELMYTRSTFQTPDMQAQHDILEEVARLVDAGVLQTTLTELGGPLSAETLRQAHAKLEAGSMIGKLVLSGL